ncbi:MAG: MmgE/PrpD family protein [Halobacteria archaeon]
MKASQGLQDFSDWYQTLGFDDLPGDVVELAKLEVANELAAVYATLHTDRTTMESGEEEGDGSVTVEDELCGGSFSPEAGEYPVVGRGTADLFSSYFLNSVRSIKYDYDDYLFMGHSGHSAVFGSLAVAPDHRSTRSFLRDVVAVNELGGRLGAASFVGPYNGQMWSYIHAAGCAAVSGSLMGDGAGDVMDSVCLSVSQPSLPVRDGFLAGDGKCLTAANSGVLGLRSGMMSSNGFSSDKRVFDEFLDEVSYLPLPELLSGFGESWVTRTLCFKPYPGCAYLQAPVELLDREVVGAGGVESLRYGVSLPTVEMDRTSDNWIRTEPTAGVKRKGGAGKDAAGEKKVGDTGKGGDRGKREPNSVAVGFSVPHSVSAYLSGGGVDIRYLSESYLQDNWSEIESKAGSVDAVHDPELTRDVVEGVAHELPVTDLLSERETVSVLRGLRKMSSQHRGSVSVWNMARKSLGSETGNQVDITGKARSFLCDASEFGEYIGSLSSGGNLDLAGVDFGEVRFDFGAKIEGDMSTGTVYSSVERHSGSCGEPLEEIRSVVKEKFLREYDRYYTDRDGRDAWNVVTDLENRGFEELLEII